MTVQGFHRAAMVSAAAFIAACAPPSVARRYAKYYSCDVEEVEVEARGSGYRASGCGGRMDFECPSNRCHSAVLVIAKRHSQQFGCSRSDVRVKKLGGGAWQAGGCGQVLT